MAFNIASYDCHNNALIFAVSHQSTRPTTTDHTDTHLGVIS